MKLLVEHEGECSDSLYTRAFTVYHCRRFSVLVDWSYFSKGKVDFPLGRFLKEWKSISHRQSQCRVEKLSKKSETRISHKENISVTEKRDSITFHAYRARTCLRRWHLLVECEFRRVASLDQPLFKSYTCFCLSKERFFLTNPHLSAAIRTCSSSSSSCRSIPPLSHTHVDRRSVDTASEMRMPSSFFLLITCHLRIRHRWLLVGNYNWRYLSRHHHIAVTLQQ